ncbi:membrane protein DedA with SNARE-associated domain [Murinocardiopsis flavida]|uniref:Membrane protein DedA with SNARE-associated domain n=1 Tax=Murinocardiopsis flavida TaxID=645275 RepID=A0A2P8DJU1_9ACTN|nr:VTT domain-containing protein [Murinocardiopsis flavida]PSK97492.1 membrane protein DedA with SNARE-associated domain [Murinocardiopsis flavida]
MEYEFLKGQPLWIVYLTLFWVAFLRAQATYWIGRGLGAGLDRSKFARRLGARLHRAENLVNRFGPPAVTLSFLTWGLQTAINLAAGATRMRLPRYLVALAFGSLIWAAIYSVGLVAAVNLFLHSPYLVGAAVLLAVAGVAGYLWWRRRRASEAAADPAAEQVPSTH